MKLSGLLMEKTNMKITKPEMIVFDYGKALLCELVLELRIRNAEKCLDYIAECSVEINEMFRHTDQGCQNRINGTCKYGVKYMLENEEKWHCGCCGAPFKIHPLKKDIEHYFKLVELGNKK